jgi:hypothetical protein
MLRSILIVVVAVVGILSGLKLLGVIHSWEWAGYAGLVVLALFAGLIGMIQMFRR